jgi:prefoldin alpha subunit
VSNYNVTRIPAAYASVLTFALAQPHLIPLTSSLYVPGYFSHLAPKSTSDDDDDLEEEDSAPKEPKFLVDVGTGFFTTHSSASATDFYNRKIADLDTNLKDLEGIINGKGQNLRVVENVLAQKVLTSQQSGDGKTNE